VSFSLLMSVYAKDRPNDLEQCLESLARQTMPADEIILVKDGPVADALEQVIEHFRQLLPLRIISLPVNRGLGSALRAGMEQCNFDVVARMDSDDVAVERRFELQTRFLGHHQEIDVVGGAIAEFESDWSKPHALRRPPATCTEVARYAHHRNPMNHMTVMFRKAAVMAAGNYQPCQGFEDYYLWARMLMRGCRFHNLQSILVYVRCGNGMQGRRGGIGYVRQEFEALRRLRALGFLSQYEFVRNVVERGPARMIPNGMRAFLYRVFLREGH
jgi:glycosyltransferase involved in cell wall biosynthesis